MSVGVPHALLLPVPQLLVESEKQCSDLDEINEKIKVVYIFGLLFTI